jgi:hypothetical protein
MESCPLSLGAPQHCPLGGACHTCPVPAVQANTFASLSTGLTINEPGDKYEQEADRIADQVMRMPDPGPPDVQRSCPDCEEEIQRQVEPEEEEEEEVLQTKPLTIQMTPLVQRQVVPEEEEEEEGVIQTNRSLPQAQVNADASTSVRSLQGGGRPLSSSERDFFEPRFRHHFGSVRIHTGANAASLARQISARAFTYGADVFFREGQYAPGTSTGRRLLAHELTHVIQQETHLNGASNRVQRNTEPNALSEEEIQDAMAYNRTRFEDPYSIRIIREVMGMDRFPAVITREFVIQVVRWQAAHPPLDQDGMVGPRTTQTYIDELTTGRRSDLVRQLRLDNFVRVRDVNGPTYNACSTNACASTACTGNSGFGFCWEVAFRTSLRDGYIIQRIDNVWNETAPPGQPAIVQTPRYWEAWRVDRSGTVNPMLCGVNDVWSRNTRPGSRGNWRMTAKLYTVINLPSAAGFASGNVPDAGALLATTTAPSPDALGLPEGFLPIEVNEQPRRIGGEWDCTNANPALHYHRRRS